MSKTLTNVLLEIADAAERLQVGKKKLLYYRNNHAREVQNVNHVKLINDFAISCGFMIQEMGGCKLLTKVK